MSNLFVEIRLGNGIIFIFNILCPLLYHTFYLASSATHMNTKRHRGSTARGRKRKLLTLNLQHIFLARLSHLVPRSTIPPSVSTSNRNLLQCDNHDIQRESPTKSQDAPLSRTRETTQLNPEPTTKHRTSLAITTSPAPSPTPRPNNTPALFSTPLTAARRDGASKHRLPRCALRGRDRKDLEDATLDLDTSDGN